MVDDRRGEEYERVELPFIMQLKAMGWTHVKGDTEVSYVVEERARFRDVLLYSRVRDAIKRINLDENGESWLDDRRIERAVSDLESPGTFKLMETNRTITKLLITGTVIEGPDGEERVVRYIDFDNPQNNDFRVINQFRVDPPWATAGRDFVIPDIVLFINGIPIVVVECKRPDIEEPMESAINQLLRYSNQREWVHEEEGAEQLFSYVQLMVATYFYQARVSTVGADAGQYMEWNDPYPTTIDELAEDLAVKEPSSQQRLVAGMLCPNILLDIIHNFTLFREGKKIIPRYPQFRAVYKAIDRLRNNQTRLAHGRFDQRGGIVWHTQGSGKSLTMVFLVRKMRTMVDLRRFKIVVITDRKDLEKQLSETAELTGEPIQKAKKIAKLRELLKHPGAGLVFGMIQKFRDKNREVRLARQLLTVLNESQDILVLVDEAHRSHTSSLHAALVASLPNSARIGFTGTPIIQEGKKATHDIFGDFIDVYTIKQSQTDESTLPIWYEGRTSRAEVKDAESLDKVFVDMFQDRSERELEIIRKKYATKGRVLEAPGLIRAKARDMLRHYVKVILPNGFKAQVVAWSRLAAVRYQEAFVEAQRELVTSLESLNPKALHLSPEELLQTDSETQFLVAAHPHLRTIRELEFAAVISSEHNDNPSWKEWTSKSKQETRIEAFKKPLKETKLAFLVVNYMLLVGFDAPVEQVLYLDRLMKDHELLQAIARVNRKSSNKLHGLVVDYYGVAHHLKEALDVYADADVEAALTDLSELLPVLADRRARVVSIFTERGSDISDVDECILHLRDDRTRAEFQLRFKEFLQTLDAVLHLPEALAYLPDANALRYIHKTAENTYRDENLNLLGVGEKVRELIDRHIMSRGVDPRIGPIDIMSAGFEAHVQKLKTARAQAAEMEYAIRYRIRVHFDEDPVFYQKLSDKLEEILRAFRANWEELAKALREFASEVKAGRPADEFGLDSKREGPFYSIFLEHRGGTALSSETKAYFAKTATEMVENISREIEKQDFWRNPVAREDLRRWLVEFLDDKRIAPLSELPLLADKIIQLARKRHSRLVK